MITLNSFSPTALKILFVPACPVCWFVAAPKFVPPMPELEQAVPERATDPVFKYQTAARVPVGIAAELD